MGDSGFSTPHKAVAQSALASLRLATTAVIGLLAAMPVVIVAAHWAYTARAYPDLAL